MRLAINQYAARLVAWIPDVSEIPPRKLIMIGVAASVLFHVVVILLIVLLSGLFPTVDVQAPPPPREIELTVIPNEPPPEPVLPLAPNPEHRFLDQTGLDISKVAPENPDFESNENGIAASEQPGKGDIPLPNQEGRDLPFLAFRSQRALFGPSANPFPPNPATMSLKTPPAEATPPPEKDVALTPAPEPPPQPETPQKERPPSTPAPVSTPPPHSIEKTETPAVAQATPPPLKTVEKAKEDEIAIATKPPATPPPSTAQTEEPQPKPAPTPVPPVAMPTPRPMERHVMLVTPAPRPQPPVRPPTQSGTQVEQEQNRIEGNISNRGRRAANTIATPLGKYRKQVNDAIGSRWQYYVKDHQDVIALGSAQVSFLVDMSGHVRAVRVENNTSNQSFADVCERAIREAELPEPPAEAIAPMRDGHLEFSIQFTLYPFQR